jgi:tetratricopeptide (TPR) repeat protein
MPKKKGGGKAKAKGKGKGGKGKKRGSVAGAPKTAAVDPNAALKLYPRPRAAPKLASEIYRELTAANASVGGGRLVPASKRVHADHSEQYPGGFRYPLFPTAASRLCGGALERQGALRPAGAAPPLPPRTRIRPDRCRAMLARYDALVEHLAARGADSAEVLTRRATLRATLGRHADAEADARHALDLRPALATAHYQLGMALARQGQPQAAAAAFRDGLRQDAHCAPLRTALNQMLGEVQHPRRRGRGAVGRRGGSDEAIVDV